MTVQYPPRHPVRNPFLGGIAIVGMGRLGSSLHATLVDHGITPEEVVSGKRDLHKARLDAEVLWLCVPDTALVDVAAAITAKRRSLRGQVVLHSSGVYSAEVLSAARKAGGSVASVHPLMTFPTRKPVPLAGVPFAVEAAAPLYKKLHSLVRLLGGKPFRLTAAGKANYHAAAVMASPLLVSLASAAMETAQRSGLSRKRSAALLEPIMLATVRNFFRDGAAASFSGPFARGDVSTVSLHLEALAGHPSLQQVYRALASHSLLVLPTQNKIELRKALAAPPRNILGKATKKTTRKTRQL
jgi:predicted short-subunit dehydrogenase-like oxidoreductase (DUF2520 family)